MAHDHLSDYPYKCYHLRTLFSRYDIDRTLTLDKAVHEEVYKMKEWLADNVGACTFTDACGWVNNFRWDDRGYMPAWISFKYPEDLVAFKLKFGV